MKKIAVFASGGGTDFQSIIDANAKENFCQIKYLVASKPEIGAITRAQNAGITLHVRYLAGKNTHHIIECIFKCLARALRDAVEIDPRNSRTLPSTKGVLV